MPFSARFRVLPLCAAPISGRCVVISFLHTLRTSPGTVRPHRSVPDAVSVPVLASASRASSTFTPRRCRRGPRCARTRSEGRRQGRVQHIVPRINSDPGCSTPAARRNEVRLRPSEVANRGERGSQARERHAMVSAARGGAECRWKPLLRQGAVVEKNETREPGAGDRRGPESFPVLPESQW